jgi:hypothetical protein
MRSVPLIRTRSIHSRGNLSRNGRKKREGKSPRVFVLVSEQVPNDAGFAHARIRVRKGCYQYLVWRDGDKTREFYLGKKESRTPQTSSPAPAADGDQVRSSRSSSRGKTKAVRRPAR